MANRDKDLIGQLAALAAAVLDGRRTDAGVYASHVRRLLRLAPGDDLDAVDAGLRAALAFDPVGLAEISAMTGESPQAVAYWLGKPGAPKPAELARGNVYSAAGVRAYWATISPEEPHGIQPPDGAVFVPITEVEVGMVLAAGEVIAIRYTPSGKTVYFTCRDADGTEREGRGRDAAGKITVFAGPAR